MSNIFAKILKGEIPSYKIFETDHAVAILDAFPTAEGHSLLLPKAPCESLLDMSPVVASSYLAELPRLAKIVKAATGAPAVKVVQNNGAESGQCASGDRIQHFATRSLPLRPHRILAELLTRYLASRGAGLSSTATSTSSHSTTRAARSRAARR